MLAYCGESLMSISSFSLSAKYNGTFSRPLSRCKFLVDNRTAISG